MKEIILISVAGEDKVGVTNSVTSVLARHEANILDIGQSVIHETLSLGMLVEFIDPQQSSSALKDILFGLDAQGMSVKFTPISPDEYEHWVEGRSKHRHIITLLSRRIRAEQIVGITDITSELGLNIDKIERLSGRVPLDDEQQSAKACIEFNVSGRIEDLEQVRRRFLELGGRFECDIAFQEDNLFRRTRRLVCFDMDSTLIEAEVIDELAKAAGVGDQVVAITESAMRGDIDFTESFAQRLALLEGLDESVLQGIAETLPLTEGMENLISTLKRYGFKTAILSGGFNYFGRYLQNKLGFDYVYANELEIHEGKVTGKVSGTVVDGQRKAELLVHLAAQEGIDLEQVVAVGDGANDLPMLSKAGLGIAFRAKPIVKQSAKQSISTLGLDGILYLMGYRDREI
ncbi:Phosphoserine phosphatase SerB2 [BD1-7 clade bacterium]|uniref:Phosphoserine phosphatase n=1 Tax=BD1-7 clade bacterium TaxID=2029982 RepID=A0A5S9N2U8_9GAMM|nr:Phosphoserine phosphatase SerB2 [BD1-7 clade bacterium]CAA0082607.1 Phosphoserine phosphatase SerB2 [BD1-7 clade bacterium]